MSAVLFGGGAEAIVMRKLSVKLDDLTYKNFSKKCIDMGKTKSQVVRDYIKKLLKERR